MDLYNKLQILADGAKYDASCSTSGVGRSNTGKLGNSTCAGICHSWSADGRCISLLKVLLSNRCAYDCEYCINRATADVARAAFEPEELAQLTMEFYRRNYIEGLFLSSAVERNPDYTSEKMAKCLDLLRNQHGFAGYIHAKIIPGTSPELVARIGALADRVSVNAEFPSRKSLELLAPRKTFDTILAPMGQIREALDERRKLPKPGSSSGHPDLLYFPVQDPLRPEAFPTAYERSLNYKGRFAPAGQTTQMIIGAGGETDRQILRVSDGFYQNFRMKRVYFSAYIPLNESPNLPSLLTPPPLKREHRLYQADWLMRFYGFKASEILDGDDPFLDPDLDPKVMWALRHLEQFPVEINKAPLELLVRIPGVGTVSARRIVRQRRLAAVKFDDLKKLGVVVKRARYFLTCSGKYYGGPSEDPVFLKGRILAEDRLPVAEQGPLSREQIRKSLLPIDDNLQISMFQEGAFTQIRKEEPRGLLV